MNYNQQITELVETIKADKSIIQPWRNKAAARLEEAQAFVRMGLTSTTRENGREMRQEANLSQGFDDGLAKSESCECKPGRKASVSCPVHGIALPPPDETESFRG